MGVQESPPIANALSGQSSAGGAASDGAANAVANVAEGGKA